MFLPTSPRPPSGMMRMLTLSSWQQAAAVTRKQRRLADVPDTGRLRDEALQPEREAAVWRHPVSKRVEVRGERRLVEPARAKRRTVVVAAMQAMSAGDDLHPSVQQVEAPRPLGPVRIGVGVERPLRRREALDED